MLNRVVVTFSNEEMEILNNFAKDIFNRSIAETVKALCSEAIYEISKEDIRELFSENEMKMVEYYESGFGMTFGEAVKNLCIDNIKRMESDYLEFEKGFKAPMNIMN